MTAGAAAAAAPQMAMAMDNMDVDMGAWTVMGQLAFCWILVDLFQTNF